MQQYRIVKGREDPPKCLFHDASQIEDQYTLIEQSAHLVLLEIGIYYNTIRLYN